MKKGSLRFCIPTGSLFYKIIFVFILAYILSLILNYNINWMGPELALVIGPNALENGSGLVPEDLFRAFDFKHLDGIDRARFFSYFFLVLDAKFRVWLFRYISPHPSVSLTWIFSLILTPVLLFKLVYNMTRSRSAAWIGISLYCVSTGFLSGVIGLIYCAKPLVNFFVISCLYCASKISNHIKDQDYFSDKVIALYTFLLFLLVLAFFTDETAWFLLICIPILFPDIFNVEKKRTLNTLFFFSTFIFFLLFITFAAPLITKSLGFGTFNFWRYALRDGKLFELFTFRTFIYNSSKLLFCHIVPSKGLFIHEPYEWQYPLSLINGGSYSVISIIYIAVFFLFFIYLAVKLPLERKSIFLRSLITVLLFMLFHSIVQLRHKVAVHSSYYYGALFPVFLAIFFSIVLSSFEKGFSNILSKLLLILIVLASAYNFIFINQSWIDVHYIWYRDEIRDRAQYDETQRMNEDARLTYPMVLRAWRNRKDKDALMKMRSEFPPSSYWLFYELEYIKDPGDNPPPSKPLS